MEQERLEQQPFDIRATKPRLRPGFFLVFPEPRRTGYILERHAALAHAAFEASIATGRAPAATYREHTSMGSPCSSTSARAKPWALTHQRTNFMLVLHRPVESAVLYITYTLVTLLSPKLLSHCRDGSRHDFRAAAQYLQDHSQMGEFIYCDWPLTLEYYTKGYEMEPVRAWSGRISEQDGHGSWVVLASNAFSPMLRVPGYQSRLAEEIVTRRFDEQSHVIRMYHLSPNK